MLAKLPVSFPSFFTGSPENHLPEIQDFEIIIFESVKKSTIIFDYSQQNSSSFLCTLHNVFFLFSAAHVHSYLSAGFLYTIFLLYHSRKFENSQLVFAFFYGNLVTNFLQEQEIQI